MHQDNVVRSRLGKRMGHVALFVALAVVPVLALNSLATATPTPDGGTEARPGPTDAQRECLTQHGITLPARGADGAKPARTQEQRRQLQEAGQACGLRGRGPRPMLRALTDEQRQCLAEQGVTPPSRPADGTRPELSTEQRDALRQAAEACGLPARGQRDAGVDGTI